MSDLDYLNNRYGSFKCCWFSMNRLLRVIMNRLLRVIRSGIRH